MKQTYRVRKDNLLSVIFTRLVFVSFLQYLTLSLTGMIDTAVTGRVYGAAGLSAMQLASPIYWVFAFISQIFAGGLSVVLVRLLSEGKKDSADRVLSYACVLCAGAGLLFTVFGLFSPAWMAHILAGSKAEAVVFANVEAYLRPVLLGAPVILLYDIFNAAALIEGSHFRMLVSVFAMIFTDVIGDLLAVEMKAGLLGIAVASVFAYLVPTVILAAGVFRKDSIFRFDLSSFSKEHPGEIFRNGFPSGIRSVCLLLNVFLINHIMMTWGSADGVAAISVYGAIQYVPAALITAIAYATLLITGILHSEEDHEGLSSQVKEVLIWCTAVVPLICALLWLCGPYLIMLFTSEELLQSLTLHALRWYLLSVPFSALNQSATAFLQGQKRHQAAGILNLINLLVLPVSLALIFGIMFHTEGIFASVFAAEFFMFMLHLILYVLSLPEKKSLQTDMNRNVSEIRRVIHDVQEVVHARDEIEQLCLSRSVSRRKSMLMALCMEELAENSIEHGFSDGRPHHLEIRFVISGTIMILRLRDDCRMFDLKERYEMLNPKDLEKNIGLRLIFAGADEVTYSYAVRMNNVCIRIPLYDKDFNMTQDD